MTSKIKGKVLLLVKWLIKTIAENLVGVILVSSSALVVIVSFLSSISKWLQWLINIPMVQWSFGSKAIILSTIILLSVTITFVFQKIIERISPKFLWVEHAGLKWKVWKKKEDVEWMPFCSNCQVKL